MAFTDLGSLGAIGNSSNNQTTLDLVTSAAIAAGDFVVVVVGADNIANGGDDNAVTGVTLGVGGQALAKGVQVANALAAQAGASCSIWYGIALGALGSGGTIRATFGSASLVDASAATARKFSVGAGNTVAVEGTPGTLVSNTGADPGSLNVTTANIECLRIRGIASQVGNNTNITPGAGFTAWANGNSATSGTTAEICARAAHAISTATGAASDPTYVSAIYASVYVAFKELVNKRLTADANAYALTGAATTAVLLKRKLDATTGESYALSGSDAAITKTVPLVNKTLPTEAGAYALAGDATAAIVRRFWIDATSGGGYALTGAGTTALLARRKSAALGSSYALTGSDAAIFKLAHQRLPADASVYALTGTSAGIVVASFVGKTIAAAPASYALSGSSAIVNRLRVLNLQAGTAFYALAGNVARLFCGEWPLSARSVAAAVENRSADVLAERRSVAAVAESRSVRVLTESRSVSAPTESRTIEVQGESHGVSEMV